MPREVFADEIERFLETLAGVSSARVLTGSSGDVSYVYVTTETAADSRGLRHGVVAALQSQFGIPIDEWRVRITQLRAGLQPSEIPHFRVARVEETAAGADLAVTVKLQWARGSDDRTATGQARARAGAAPRSRALAAATISAVRDALEVPHGHLTLDRVGGATFLDRPVVLVAVSAGIAGETRTFLGAAFDDGPSSAAAEPAITAALDAVTRWLLQAAFAADVARSPRRRDRLEAMRHFVLAAAEAAPVALRASQHGAPDAAPVALRASQHEAPDAAPVPAADSYSDRHPGMASRVAPVRALPPRRAGMPRNGARATEPPAAAPAGEVPPAAAETADGAPFGLARHAEHRNGGLQIAPRPKGPETKEGTAMGLQHDTPEVGSGVRTARAAGVEDAFYRSLVVERTPVHLRCRDGYEVPHAIVRDAGTYALLVETEDGLELFFKHAIISIRVLPKAAAQA